MTCDTSVMGFMENVREQQRAAREANAGKPKPSASARMTGVSQYLTPYGGPQWEYAVVNFVDKWTDLNDMRRQLDQMGAHGWEMCERRESGTGVTRQGGAFITFIFKRRKV